jgi:hypothetical protein
MGRPPLRLRHARHACALGAVLVLLLGLVTGCPFSAETFVQHCALATDCDDGNPCTEDLCTNTVCSNPDKAAEASCPTGVCDGSGKCLECLTSPADDVVCGQLHPTLPVCDATTKTCVGCLTDADCMKFDSTNPVCWSKNLTCVSCHDGVRDGNETGVDCGGPDCGACQADPCDPVRGCGDGSVCAMPENICCNTACSASTMTCMACAMKDGATADGTCSEVPLGEDPFNQCSATGGSPLAGGCGKTMGKCACEDGVKDEKETDVDCGGPVCPGCLGGQMCEQDTDCNANYGFCISNVCCNALCTGQCRFCNSAGMCGDAPPGYPNPACLANQACGSGPLCVGKAGAPCIPANKGGDCVSGVCSAAKTCAQSMSGQPCSSTADCLMGTCQNYICM